MEQEKLMVYLWLKSITGDTMTGEEKKLATLLQADSKDPAVAHLLQDEHLINRLREYHEAQETRQLVDQEVAAEKKAEESAGENGPRQSALVRFFHFAGKNPGTVAAILLATVTLVMLVIWMVSQPAPAAMLQTSTRAGEHASIVLPDGSTVFLNGASTLSYPAFFDKHERKVSLKGEAYFEVKKDKDTTRHFIVAAAMQPAHYVEVLSTAFCVSVRGENLDFTTSVVRGKVKIHNQDTLVAIQAGEEAAFSPSGSMYTGHFDSSQALGWLHPAPPDEKVPTVRNYLEQVGALYKLQVVYRLPRENKNSLDLKIMAGNTINIGLVTALAPLRSIELRWQVEDNLLLIYR